MGIVNALKNLLKLPVADGAEDEEDTEEQQFETHYTMDGKEYRLPVDGEDDGTTL